MDGRPEDGARLARWHGRHRVARAEPQTPAISTVSAATAYHEAIEAMRWARQLIASGAGRPADIAIAIGHAGRL